MNVAYEKDCVPPEPPTRATSRGLVEMAGVALAYILAARLGVMLAMPGNQATPVWPPSGIALAAVLLYGRKIWPGIWLGALLANTWGAFTLSSQTAVIPTVVAAACMATGACLAALLGAFWVKPSAQRSHPFCDVRAVFTFMTMSGALACVVSASIGAGALVTFGLAPGSEAGTIWLTWWLGDTAGVLVVAPLLIAWAGRFTPALWTQQTVLHRGGKFELAMGVFTLCWVAWLIFLQSTFLIFESQPDAYLLFPAIVWLAVRFGLQGATLAVALTATLSVLGTAGGLGPFHAANLNSSLLNLELFLCLLVLLALSMAAMVGERDRAQAGLTCLNAELDQRVQARSVELLAANAELRDRESRLRVMADSLPVLIHYVDAEEHYRYVNSTGLTWYAQGVGQYAGDILGRSLRDVHPPQDYRLLKPYVEQVLSGETVQFETRITVRNGETRHRHVDYVPHRSATGGVLGFYVLVRDITAEKQASGMVEAQLRVLEMIASGQPLADSLRAVVELMEAQAGDLLGSILFLDADGKRLRHGAAPSLPEAYTRAIDGVVIGDRVGSCGTAAFRGESVHVADIAADPLWEDYRHVALPNGLRACWSTPVKDTQGRVLGTCAVYRREPGLPTEEQTRLIGIATHLAAICLSRHREEAELFANRELLVRVLNTNPAIISVKDRDSRIHVANETLARLYRLSLVEMVGRLHAELHAAAGGDPRQLEQWLADDQRVIDVGVPLHREELADFGDGCERWFNAHKFPIRLADGQPGVLVVSVDITDIKAAEQAVERSERRFRSLIENAQDMVAVLDQHLVFQFHSPSSRRLIGYEPEELVGRNVLEFIHPDDLPLIQGAIARGDQVPTSSQGAQFRFRHADGSWRTLESIGQKVDQDGQKVIIVNSRDITERVRLEEQYRQSQKMEAIGKLAAGVAHDFNNLLTVIQGQSSLLLMEPGLTPAISESASEISTAAERAAGLTRQLLLFSRRQSIQLREVDLNEVVGGVARMFRRVIGEDVQLVVHSGKGRLNIRADVGMMEQVLMNLAVNARDAMSQGGTLTLSTQSFIVRDPGPGSPPGAQPGDYALLMVVDTGCGISPESMSRLFEPFYTTKGPGKGTGLGLATVYGIVRQHNGWVEVESEVGRGTCFKVLLPLAAVLKPVEPKPVQATESRGGHETILLVEDEPGVRALTETVLQRRGYRVISADCGDEAVRLWEAHSATIDLLLTDVIMPGQMTGRDLAERLLQEQPRLKVIFMSGYTAEIFEDGYLTQPGRHFLQKPYTPTQLAQVVRECLEGTVPRGGAGAAG